MVVEEAEVVEGEKEKEEEEEEEEEGWFVCINFVLILYVFVHWRQFCA